MRSPTLCALLASCALAACGGEGSLGLEVSTDLPTPAADTELSVDVSQAGNLIFSSKYALSRTPDEGGTAMPATLVLVGEGGDPVGQGSLTPGVLMTHAEGPLSISVALMTGGATTVQRAATVAVPGTGRKTLHLTLEQSCIGVSCAADQTCDAGKCVASDIDVSSLPDD